MTQEQISISGDKAFYLSYLDGNVYEDSHHGLFVKDTRHISLYKLFIDDELPELLNSKTLDFNRMFCVLTNRPTQNLQAKMLSITRSFLIDTKLHEDITITNESETKVDFQIKLHIDVDFADLFDVKEAYTRGNNARIIKRTPLIGISTKQNYVHFHYTRGGFNRETYFFFNQKMHADNNLITFPVSLKPHTSWILQAAISTSAQSKLYPVKSSFDEHDFLHSTTKAVQDWHWSIPRLTTDWDDLEHIYTKSIFDLGALRTRLKTSSEKIAVLPTAGFPWFMTIFGRDSLITAYQTILFGDHLAEGTLRALAELQGKVEDQESEEEPGKILHEMRFGEIAHFGDWVKFPYYGTIDATPLFLILCSQVYRWTGDRKVLHTLKPHMLKALQWIDTYGDMDQDGFVEYERKSKKGLLNQNWRDSALSMLHENGKPASAPIAPADVQGYVYDAKMRMADIAANVWAEHKLAKKLRNHAKKLKSKFNKMFWLADGKYFALALDREKKPIKTLSSSIGHLLWSGIVDHDKIKYIVKHIMSENLYSGWGVRTIGKDEAAYNPLEYHRGTLWPHDNSLIAAGLDKTGYHKEKNKIIHDMISASTEFGYRLPEVFAGYGRRAIPFPVPYPTSSSPQAWAAATPILFIRLLLGLKPDMGKKVLTIDPKLPHGVHRLTLDGVQAFGKYFRIDVFGDKSKIEQVRKYRCHLCKTHVASEHTHRS